MMGRPIVRPGGIAMTRLAAPLPRRRPGLARTASLVVLVLAGVAGAQEVRVERDVPARMRDGVVLRADVYRPAEGGPYPVLVLRTPYGKQGVHPEAHAKAGYI